MYDQREKALRDHEWALAGARREGHQEGREEGREEGALTGQVRLLQQLLGEPPAPVEELLSRSSGDLSELIAGLQARLRGRLRPENGS